MEISETQRNDCLVVTLRGRLDSTTSPGFEQQALDMLARHPRLVLDFTDVDYISSAGLRVLLLIAKKTKQGGGALVLCGLRDSLREIFEISGFMAILDIRPTLADTPAGAA